MDGGRIAAKLSAKVVEPGWWLAAPLDDRWLRGSGEPIDWSLVKVSTKLFGSCGSRSTPAAGGKGAAIKGKEVATASAGLEVAPTPPSLPPSPPTSAPERSPPFVV